MPGTWPSRSAPPRAARRSRATQARALLAAAASVALASACATGDSFIGESSGPSSSATTAASTGGAGGAGGSDATTTATSTTTTSGAGGSSATTTGGGGSGGTCSEDPCKLVDPQCGCPAGQQCSVAVDGRFCTGEGTAAWGEQCSGVAKCEPGLLCIQTTPTVSTCAKFCADDTDCQAPGGLCVVTLNDGLGGTIPGVELCTQNCDPITNSGCGVAGTACSVGIEQDGLMRVFSICGGAGAGTQGSACVGSDDCAATHVCVTPSGGSAVCAKWCNVNQSACGGGTLCQPLTIGAGAVSIQLGAVEYGACL